MMLWTCPQWPPAPTQSASSCTPPVSVGRISHTVQTRSWPVLLSGLPGYPAGYPAGAGNCTVMGYPNLYFFIYLFLDKFILLLETKMP